MTYFRLFDRYMVPSFLNGFLFYDVPVHEFCVPISKVLIGSRFWILLIVSSFLSEPFQISMLWQCHIQYSVFFYFHPVLVTFISCQKKFLLCSHAKIFHFQFDFSLLFCRVRHCRKSTSSPYFYLLRFWILLIVSSSLSAAQICSRTELLLERRRRKNLWNVSWRPCCGFGFGYNNFSNRIIVFTYIF